MLREPKRHFLPDTYDAWRGVAAGAFIACFAFIGFDDRVNMAKEVKNPRPNLPGAIFIALTTTTLDISVALTALAPFSLPEIPGTTSSLMLIGGRNTVVARWRVGAMKLAAIGHGCLLLTTMAARVVYGMGRLTRAPPPPPPSTAKPAPTVLATPRRSLGTRLRTLVSAAHFGQNLQHRGTYCNRPGQLSAVMPQLAGRLPQTSTAVDFTGGAGNSTFAIIQRWP